MLVLYFQDTSDIELLGSSTFRLEGSVKAGIPKIHT